MITTLNLFKLQAYGNDFLVTEDPVPEERLGDVAKTVCSRHFGAGADGLLTLKEENNGSFNLRIINADGSEAGMSGNGGRCAAGYLHYIKDYPDQSVRFTTISGDKIYKLEGWAGLRGTYTSLMGVPAFNPEAIPFDSGDPSLESVRKFLLPAEGLNVEVFALSVGNPQCVLFRDTLPREAEQAAAGRIIENHPFFPERTNVSFVKVVSRSHIRIKIWERGVGITSSSGTGSCGAAVAAMKSGHADSPLTVETDAGKQTVEWSAGTQIKLTGDVVFVAEMKMRF